MFDTSKILPRIKFGDHNFWGVMFLRCQEFFLGGGQCFKVVHIVGDGFFVFLKQIIMNLYFVALHNWEPSVV